MRVNEGEWVSKRATESRLVTVLSLSIGRPHKVPLIVGYNGGVQHVQDIYEFDDREL